MKKLFLSIALVCLAAFNAQAASYDLGELTANIVAQDGDTLIGVMSGTGYKISVADGATITLDNISINADGAINNTNIRSGINCLGSATLIIKDECIVKSCYTSSAGINVNAGYTLTIKEDAEGGSLDVSVLQKGAAIGANANLNGGNIIIKSGTITATSLGEGAAIGASAYTLSTTGHTQFGNITIEGGVVNANGGQSNAAIGAAWRGHCGNITITGGSISAVAGNNAAGIGGGSLGNCGNITITGGSIVTTGGAHGAGIGGSFKGNCGDITIALQGERLYIEATAGSTNAHSVGSGYTESTCGTVMIDGVNAGEQTINPYIYDRIEKNINGIVYELDNVAYTATVVRNGSSIPAGTKINLIIPASVSFGGNDYDVTAIGARAFNVMEGIGSVSIPATLVGIGDMAFEMCSDLAAINVDVNNPVYVSVDGVLFSKDMTTLILYPEAREVTEYVVPDGVTTIAEGAFGYVYSITSLVLPASLTTIGARAFEAFGPGTIGTEVIVTCHALVPPTLGERAFLYIDAHQHPILYVHESCLDLYNVRTAQTDWGWWFLAADIHAIEETGIEDLKIDAVKADKVLIDGQVYILRDGKLYNVAGELQR